MKYLLNSAVITAPGVYKYSLIDVEEAMRWLHRGEWESCIGYQETADALNKISIIKVEVNRKVISMKVGDEALVFRLVFPQGYRPYPAKKGEMGVEFILKNCELGILRRIE